MKYVLIAAAAFVLTLIVHSKLSPKTRAELDSRTSTYVDQASSAALDATQKGLSKANEELSETRKHAAK